MLINTFMYLSVNETAGKLCLETEYLPGIENTGTEGSPHTLENIL